MDVVTDKSLDAKDERVQRAAECVRRIAMSS